MKRLAAVGASLIALAILFWGGYGYYTATSPTQSIDDAADLLSLEQERRIAEFHRYLLADHDIDYRIVTYRETGDIDRFTWRRFTDHQVGRDSHSGRALLLVVDPAQDRLRLETSRALESVYPDAFVAYIEHRQMTPFFASGRIADGILATTELIVSRAQRAEANAAWDDEPWAQSSGGGAAAPARIDAGPGPKSDRGVAPTRNDSPRAVLDAYIEAMRSRNDNPDLPIYGAASRRMLAGWTVTPAQMDNAVRSFVQCNTHPTRLFANHERAVIRYPVAVRACHPWFFVREQGAWRLDLTVMQNLIRFGRDNSWHFVKPDIAENPYGFAFVDWRLDRRGYPWEKD